MPIEVKIEQYGNAIKEVTYLFNGEIKWKPTKLSLYKDMRNVEISKEKNLERHRELNAFKELLYEKEKEIITNLKGDQSSLRKLLEDREAIIAQAKYYDDEVLRDNLNERDLENRTEKKARGMASIRGDWTRLNKLIATGGTFSVDDYYFFVKRKYSMVMMYMNQTTFDKIVENGAYRGSYIKEDTGWSYTVSDRTVNAKKKRKLNFPITAFGYGFAGAIKTIDKGLDDTRIGYGHGDEFYRGEANNVRVVKKSDARAKLEVE